MTSSILYFTQLVDEYAAVAAWAATHYETLAIPVDLAAIPGGIDIEEFQRIRPALKHIIFIGSGWKFSPELLQEFKKFGSVVVYQKSLKSPGTEYYPISESFHQVIFTQAQNLCYLISNKLSADGVKALTYPSNTMSEVAQLIHDRIWHPEDEEARLFFDGVDTTRGLTTYRKFMTTFKVRTRPEDIIKTARMVHQFKTDLIERRILGAGRIFELKNPNVLSGLLAVVVVSPDFHDLTHELMAKLFHNADVSVVLDLLYSDEGVKVKVLPRAISDRAKESDLSVLADSTHFAPV